MEESDYPKFVTLTDREWVDVEDNIPRALADLQRIWGENVCYNPYSHFAWDIPTRKALVQTGPIDYQCCISIYYLVDKKFSESVAGTLHFCMIKDDFYNCSIEAKALQRG